MICCVAPLVGAWIEITVVIVSSQKFRSLPSWERGLKYQCDGEEGVFTESLPSWERGLK